jgi:hypothetical protein
VSWASPGSSAYVLPCLYRGVRPPHNDLKTLAFRDAVGSIKAYEEHIRRGAGDVKVNGQLLLTQTGGRMDPDVKISETSDIRIRFIVNMDIRIRIRF